MEKWCTYGSWGKKSPSFIGQLVEQSGRAGKIRYSENQMYSLEYWDMDYVEVFDNLEDAILFFHKQRGESLTSIKESLYFEEKNNVDWDEIKDKIKSGKIKK